MGNGTPAVDVGPWHPREEAPPYPAIYTVLVDGEQRYARWTGVYWCNWSPYRDRAAQCYWRGPAAGFEWR